MDNLGYSGEEQFSGADTIVRDSNQSEIEKLASKWNIELNPATKDYLYQYFLNEQSSQNAFNRELEASSTQYQRAVEDMKKAGLNPFLAFDSLRSGSASSSAGSSSGGSFISIANSKRENAGNVAKGIMSMLAIIAGAVIAAML